MTAVNFKYQNELFRPKDFWSAATHFAGYTASIIAMPFLLIKAGHFGADSLQMRGYAVFMLSMIILYGASTAYHSFNVSPDFNMILKRIDHCSIFLLIAGSYTPVCLTVLEGSGGYTLLAVIWLAALAGIIFKICWVTCPRVVSSVIYIGMGWAALSVLPRLYTGLGTGFAWLLAGGLMYTAGGIIYAIKPALFPKAQETGFGNHELFHCFVLAGSLCHYIMVSRYIIPMI
ncbi:MAG: hemolysin III family protein [Solobacterium sp.]|nr:hemolysin III family protein [Solobacterium sp.]